MALSIVSVFFCKRQSSGWTTITQQNQWIVCCQYLNWKHCSENQLPSPKFINFVIQFWQELEGILGERMFKQTVSKILHCGFKLFLFHVWELHKFLCSMEQVNIQTSVMNSDDSLDAEIVSLFKVIVWFLQTSQEHGILQGKLSTLIYKGVNHKGCQTTNHQSSRTYTVRHVVRFTQLLCWEPLAGDCDNFLKEW